VPERSKERNGDVNGYFIPDATPGWSTTYGTEFKWHLRACHRNQMGMSFLYFDGHTGTVANLWSQYSALDSARHGYWW
jgi:hypothetical protein